MLDKILPIGSVVKLKDAEKSIMIFGIMQTIKAIDGSTVKYDYIGVPYPVGYLSPKLNLGFNHEQIETVIFKGYDENEEYESFISSLKMAKFIDENREKINDAMSNKK